MNPYFGAPWPSGVCDDEGAWSVPTPVGKACLGCGVPVEEGDQGVIFPALLADACGCRPFHKDCLLRSIRVDV